MVCNPKDVYCSPTSTIKIFLNPKPRPDNRLSCFYNDADEEIFKGFFDFNTQKDKKM